MQGAKTNFETDLFMPIIREIEKMSGKTYDPDGDTMSFKVIADHIRSLAFAIGDGALPGNEGRGYVLRRLLRRAVMHGRRLGISDAFLYKLVPTVGQIMESYYPEVLEKKDFNVKKKPLHVPSMQVQACLTSFLLTLRNLVRIRLRVKTSLNFTILTDSQWN